MSAWIVSEKHVLTLAYFYEKMVTGNVKDGKPVEMELLKKTARVLWSENSKSVNYRYGEKYRTRFSHAVVLPIVDLTLEALVKNIGCWEYQTCEHDGHEKSKAWKMMTELKGAILWEIMYNHPAHKQEYEAGKWGL